MWQNTIITNRHKQTHLLLYMYTGTFLCFQCWARLHIRQPHIISTFSKIISCGQNYLQKSLYFETHLLNPLSTLMLISIRAIAGFHGINTNIPMRMNGDIPNPSSLPPQVLPTRRNNWWNQSSDKVDHLFWKCKWISVIPHWWLLMNNSNSPVPIKKVSKIAIPL